MKWSIILLAFTGVLFAEENWTPDVIKNIGEYRLEIMYLHKGKRSEGMDGKLYLGKDEILGKIGDVKKVDEIEIRNYGTERKMPWAITGWNLNPTIENSWKIPKNNPDK
jgi:hypothetical protein